MAKGPDPIKLIFKGLKAIDRASKKAAREAERRQKLAIREEASWLREQERQQKAFAREGAARVRAREKQQKELERAAAKNQRILAVQRKDEARKTAQLLLEGEKRQSRVKKQKAVELSRQQKAALAGQKAAAKESLELGKKAYELRCESRKTLRLKFVHQELK